MSDENLEILDELDDVPTVAVGYNDDFTVDRIKYRTFLDPHTEFGQNYLEKFDECGREYDELVRREDVEEALQEAVEKARQRERRRIRQIVREEKSNYSLKSNAWYALEKISQEFEEEVEE